MSDVLETFEAVTEALANIESILIPRPGVVRVILRTSLGPVELDFGVVQSEP